MSLISEIVERGASHAEDAFRLIQEDEYVSLLIDFIVSSHPALKLAYVGLILLSVALLAFRHRSKTGFIRFIRQIAVWLLVVVCIVMGITIIAHLKASLSGGS